MKTHLLLFFLPVAFSLCLAATPPDSISVSKDPTSLREPVRPSLNPSSERAAPPFRAIRFRPVEMWSGERITFLTDALYGERRLTGFVGFARGVDGNQEMTDPPSYSELAGRSAVVENVRNLGNRLLMILRMEDNGEHYSTFIYPTLSFDSRHTYSYDERGLNGVAPLLDIEYARQVWLDRSYFLNVDDIHTVDIQSDDIYPLYVGKGNPVKVIDVEAGWDHQRPVRLVLETRFGDVGFLDINLSGTNVSSSLRHFFRFDTLFTKPRFSLLDVTHIFYDRGMIRVDGITDLPDGAELSISFSSAAPEIEPRFLGTQRNARVNGRRFTAFFKPPADSRNKINNCSVRISYSPLSQPDSVMEMTGSLGENLVGPKAQHALHGHTVLSHETKREKSLCRGLSLQSMKETEKQRSAYIDDLRDQFAEQALHVEVYGYEENLAGLGLTYESYTAVHALPVRVSLREARDLGFKKMTLSYGEENSWTFWLEE